MDSTEYGFTVGDKVCHVKDHSVFGICTQLDSDYDLGGITTCGVVWGVESLNDAMDTSLDETDIQWTNKLILFPW